MNVFCVFVCRVGQNRILPFQIPCILYVDRYINLKPYSVYTKNQYSSA